MPTTVANTAHTSPLHVAVAVIFDGAGRVLVALREKHRHQGGKWEFPGGKVETGETPEEALAREIKEEVGLTIRACHPLKKISFAYSDRHVLLDIWAIRQYSGEARGLEGQRILWLPVGELDRYEFPEANIPIVRALQFPQMLSIIPSSEDISELLRRLDYCKLLGRELLWLRQTGAEPGGDQQTTAVAIDYCHDAGMELLIDLPAESPQQSSPISFIASGQQLRTLSSRPNALASLFVARCHSAEELHLAEKLGVDFALLAPISHSPEQPPAEALDYERFARLASSVHLPVYAVADREADKLKEVLAYGGWGLACMEAEL